MAVFSFHDAIIASAFRRLGLSGSATQRDVDAAARRMRLWNDPTRIPPTQWDLPPLGPLSRSRPDIEQAVMSLAEAPTRLLERLIWYCGPDAVTSLAAQAPTMPPTSAADAMRAHDRAVQLLHYVVCAPVRGRPAAHWKQAYQFWSELCASPHYLRAMCDLEMQGNFEKRAREDEVAAVISNFPGRLAAAILSEAEAALDRDEPEVGVDLATSLQHPGGTLDPLVLMRLLDRLEDGITIACGETDSVLRERLRTNHANPYPFFARNKPVATDAQAIYRKAVAPRLAALHLLGVSDPGRVRRVNSACAKVLTLLAMGWEWAGETRAEQRTLNEALELVLGSFQETIIRKRLTAAAERLRIARNPLRRFVAKRRARKAARLQAVGLRKRKSRTVWGALGLFIFLGNVVSHLVSDSPSSNRPLDLTSPIVPTPRIPPATPPPRPLPPPTPDRAFGDVDRE